ncbi:MAG: hypothetical protein J6M23_06950 [Bacteroidales bacterium]|nr:hypothetical protein [Bacteroidales bacterium]
MTEQQLKQALRKLREKGFDGSFSDYCAATFSSYTYPDGGLAAARMHAFFLRYFIEAYLDEYFSKETRPGGIEGTIWKVGKLTIDETLSTENATAMTFCRSFVKNWCEAHSSDGVSSLRAPR